MYRRISTLLSQELFSSNHSFDSAFCSVIKQSSYFPYTEKILASHIATLLEQKSSHLLPQHLQKTKQIHAQITVNGLRSMGILATRILGLYLLSNNYYEVKRLFTQLDLCFAAPWNWMIRGFTMMGCYENAVLFYFKMLISGTTPDKYTFPWVIKACSGLGSAQLVKYVHGMAKDLGFELDVFVGSALLKFYAENDRLNDARRLFDKLPQRDIVLWNVMLNGYLKSEDSVDNVVGLFKGMRSEVEPDSVTYACVLSSCGSKSMVRVGSQVHGLVSKCGLEMDSRVLNSLLSMYAKSRCLIDAKKLFDFVARGDIITWNGMIGGYVQNGLMNEALDLFRRMISLHVEPDSVTFASLFPSVSELGCFDLGKEIHCYIIRHGVILDLFIRNALIDMYFKSKDVRTACEVFYESSQVDIVICTAMISGFVLNGMNLDALKIFRSLLDMKMRPNAVTLACVLPACAGLASLSLGKELHCYIIRKGLEARCYAASALTDMYAKCGRLDLGYQAFTRMSERDSVCWNSMITNCVQNGKPEVAIDLLRQMGEEKAKHDCVTISAALSSCANLSNLYHGKEIHGFMIRCGFNYDIFSNSALIDMYAKCGDLDMAQRTFNTMQIKNEVSWNSIISAYGNHGKLTQCLALFQEMKDEGFKPDHVTFLAIISACGHSGQVEETKHHFDRMIQDYKITPRMEHYACLIDAYGRAGHLKQAFELIKDMPFEPDAGIWGTLLGACRVHNNVELAEEASKKLFHLDPENSGYYVLLANLHADSGTWDRVDQIRSVMKERGVQKVTGFSWIEVNNSSHLFSAADKRHPQASDIYSMLDNLLVELRNEGDGMQLYPLLHPQNGTGSVELQVY